MVLLRRAWDHTTADPVLVVGNPFDPATPCHGMVTVDRLLPRSRLLTLAGWGTPRCPRRPASTAP
jgi:TAP-like protein